MLGLDKPLHVQFWNYVVGILTRGDLGLSLETTNSVTATLLQRFPASFELITVALLIAIVIGVPLGIVAATHKNRVIDHLSRLFAIFGVASPRFWLAIMLQVLFAYYLGVLPIIGRADFGVAPSRITGLYLMDSLLTLNFAAFLSSLRHIILPAFALSVGPIAQITRMVRSGMIEQSGKDYILTARANGLSENLILYKYMLKNAFTSTLSVIGLMYGYMLGGAFLVEAVFSWPGIASAGVTAVLAKDFNMIIGVTLVMGLWYVIVNFAVDVLHSYIDPRIRYG
jgi:peptide/nickel transport system permease protein